MLLARIIILISLYILLVVANITVDDVHRKIFDGPLTQLSRDKDVSQPGQHNGRSAHLEAPPIESKKKEQTRGSARRRPIHRLDASAEVPTPKNRTDTSNHEGADEVTKPRPSRRNSMLEVMVQSASEADALSSIKQDRMPDKDENKTESTVASVLDPSLKSVKLNSSTESIHMTNQSSELTTNTTSNSSKIGEFEIRRKNTVAMSERLYNHFRPVEENIPIEERTQFLFFGQKLTPGLQNGTELASASSSKRRYTIKRFNATTPIPSLKPRNVTSEGGNSAAERQVAEKNNNAKAMKSTLRTAASSSYYRKTNVGLSDTTIVTNIIQNSSGQHSMDNETKTSKKMEMKMEPRSNKHATGNSNETNSTMENSIIGSRQGTANVTVNGSALAENRKPLIWRNSASRSKKNETERRPDKPEAKVVNRGTNGSAQIWTTSEASAERKSANSQQTKGEESSIATTTANSQDDGTKIESGSASASAAVVAPVASQQHMYAYTISNVTRLLRNYTGPGLSSSEDGSGATGMSEIKKSGLLLRLLLLVPTPRTAIEEAGRSRSELSAGTTVEQITTQVEPARTLVGQQRTGKGSTAASSQLYQAPGGIVVVTSSSGAAATDRWSNLTYAPGKQRPVKLAERERQLHVWKTNDPVTQLSKVARPRNPSTMAIQAKTVSEEATTTVRYRDPVMPLESSQRKGEQEEKVTIGRPGSEPEVSGTTMPGAQLSAGEFVLSTISDSDDYRPTTISEAPDVSLMPREEMDNQIVKMPSSTAKPYHRAKLLTTTQPPPEPTTFKFLDPSEIQKKYRARPAVTTTASTPSDSPQEDDLPKDKDDVLPIMHLYNTSSIFNDTNIMGSRSRIEAVLRSKQLSSFRLKQDEKKETAEAVTTDANELVNAAKAESRSRNNTARRRLPDSSDGGSRKDEPNKFHNSSNEGRVRQRTNNHREPEYGSTDYYPIELNRTFFEPGLFALGPRESRNFSDVIFKRHDGDAIATQETVAVVSYILATLVVFPIAVGVGLILRRLIIRNRKVLEESDTSSEISCKKDALNLENGDFKTSLENAITKLPRIQHLCHETEKLPPVSSDKSRWEFSRDKLRLQTVLGEGNFGQVWKAEADDLTGHQGTTRLVAVKTVKEGASDREKEDLVRELEIMQRVGSHPNVVTLLGCCTEEEPHYLILEYVMYGKLLTYLRDHRTRQDFYNFSEDSAALTSRDLTVFGYCVARGMEYLVSKKIIHRDLAARNVLVDHNKLCKIADFGMSRFANEDGEVIETRHGRNALPIRWMAPESLIYSLFTTKTDVWSFGILMWEIVTLGSTPYPDMTARDVMRNVQSGYRLERPSHCRNELFRVILRCWHADPDRRPEFSTIRRDLAQLLEDNMNGQYVDLESFASECID